MGESITTNGHYRSNTATMYAQGPYAPKRASPPTPSFRSDIFAHNGHSASAQAYNTSPTTERRPGDRNGAMPSLSASTSDPNSFARDTRSLPTVLIRRLPRNITPEALRTLLIFAEDLVETDFVRTAYPDDQGFTTAIARFDSSQGAMEVQQKLHGKPNTASDATMLVEVLNVGPSYAFERRNTIDGTASRTQNSSASSGRSRFNSTFQSTSERISPTLPTSSSSGNVDFPTPENSVHFQTLFSPRSPLANGVDGYARISGKSTINDDDNVDDETGELLKDPIAYARSGQHPAQRRATNPAIPVTRFGSLSLNLSNGHSNGMNPPLANGLPKPRGNASISVVNGHHNGGPNGFYGQDFHRVPPAINPADQNPPCNTLYVGNLPMDTSEDELKALFSKQRGYKRLCFRTKQNGPMCFVEFEDVSFATQALNKLYGHLLHNSVKGGIRLSFSKNPLGVRNNPSNGLGHHNPMSPQAMAPGYGGPVNGGTFSAVSGPPPGLGGPPGLANGYRAPQTGMDGMFSNAFSMPSQDFVNQLGPRHYSGGIPQPLGSGTFGRDARSYPESNGYADQGYPDYGHGR